MNYADYDWRIHEHCARIMSERLTAIRNTPRHVALIGADGHHSRQMIAHHWKTDFFQYERFAERLGKKRWFFPMRASDKLPSNAFDALWCNLNLWQFGSIDAALEAFAKALKPEGMLFFRHFGVDTLREWLPEGSLPLIADMHDIGDALLSHGFYDPVTDMEHLKLEYASGEVAVRDMCALGLLPETHSLQKMLAAAPSPQITLEIVYGHALKKASAPDNAAIIQFYPKKP